MRKGFKKLAAVALSAGLFASSFAGITPVKADETDAIKKGTVITDFKEITDVKDLVPGIQYFFSTEEYGADDAVAGLPNGSAILQFAGTDVEQAVEDGTFMTETDKEYFEGLKKSLVSYEAHRQFFFEYYGYDKIPTTEAEACEYIAEWAKLPTVPTTWEELLVMAPEVGQEFGSVDDFLEMMAEELAYFEEEFPTSEEDFLLEQELENWDEYKVYTQEQIDNYYKDLIKIFEGSCAQYDRQGYVSVVQAGPGFDSCLYGTIAYLEELVMPSAETGDENNENSQAGWYYGCHQGGVAYVGPFYLYSYKVNEFTEDDLIITFAEDWKTPTAATTVTKDDLTLSVVIDGEEIIIPFFEITDSSVDPANENTTITLVVGEITKVVEVCNIESGEIVKDVQISAGAPTVGLEDAVDALMETVLTEAELKLVKNGVDVDIYMTVVGKKAEELGEDKAILEKTMAKDDKAVYLDLKLFKKIGNNDPTAITEVPGGKIKVSVVVPDTIKKFADKAKVVRVHGTEVTELKTTYDAATNKLSFETDKFSTYAIVYNDASSETGTTPTPGTGTTPAPIAGDSAMIGVYMVVVVLAAAVVVMRKKAANV